jgi:predicted dehydrogenase
VEDDVTAYLEWENGATGTFITSTGDAPGVNRLEIALEEALIVCENDTLRIGSLKEELGMKEADYRASSEDFFRKLKGTWTETSYEKEPRQYEKILQAFADECNGIGKSNAPGDQGRMSLLLSNAMYLSSWERKMIEIPVPGSSYEQEFEKEFEGLLRKKSG